MDDHSGLVERWLPVVGYEGWYEVSDQGRIRSLDRLVTDRNGRTRSYAGALLKTSTSNSVGHRNVALCRNGAQLTRLVHSIVLEAFIGPRPMDKWGLHNNGNGSDNRLVNLRYGVPLDNILDTIRHGHNFYRNKETCSAGHLLIEPNLTVAGLRRGWRLCRACSCASAMAACLRRNDEVYDLQALRDEYYTRVIGGTIGLASRDRKTCPYGHNLALPNLTPWSVRQGLRRCLACIRAQDRGRHARRRGRPYDLAALRQQCYSEIMAAGQVAPDGMCAHGEGAAHPGDAV